MAMKTKPNVVIFLTDQQRWDCSSLHGNPLELMPNFDRIAQAHTFLAQCYTCQPVCGPARACLQTGQYATTNGVYTNHIGLPHGVPTMADCFNDAGYHTGYIGKWHLAGRDGRVGDGPKRAVHERARGGYREWLGVETLEFSVHEYHTVLYDNDNRPVRLPGYRSDAVADAGIRFIDRHQDKPFMLMMSFIEPHHQNDKDDYPPPDGYRERFAGRWMPPDLAALPAFATTTGQNNRPEFGLAGGTAHQGYGGYCGMVKRLDEAFGRVMDALKSLELHRDTIVLFTSDHGCHFRTRNISDKRSCHDASIRLPALLAGPGFEDGGRVSQMVSLVDLPPTLLQACGIEVPPTMQGRSIVPLLRREREDWPDDVFVQYSDLIAGRAVRTHRWKYAVEVDHRAMDEKGFAPGYREAYLYDMHHDPYELYNLIESEAHSRVRQIMRQRLLKWMGTVGEPQPQIEQITPRAMSRLTVREEELYQ